MEQGYYRLIERIENTNDECASEWNVGELWYLSEVEGNEVTLIQGNDRYTITLDLFQDHFDFAPEGVQERQNELGALIDDLHAIGNRQDNLIESSSTPKLLADESQPAKPQSTDLVVMASRANPVLAAKNLKKVKTAFAMTKNQIVKRQSALQTLIKEQELILKAKTELLTKQIELAQEAIYIINAYLGKDEEIIRIKKGEPASIEEKIVIRQQVLFMDEECAVARDLAKRGGIDFQNIEEFDKWVCDHTQQVLSEVKGIVAIKVRHNDKYYCDNPFVNAELNRENKCLYILIRNGENLYRIYTTLWADEVVLPRKDEFEEFFYTRKFDHNINAYRKEPLIPGSSEFMRAMEKVEAKKRRFYTFLILIQGILDRTKIFHPLSNEQINVCNLEQAHKHIILRYDAENLLGTGRPDFKKWLKSVNGELEVGCRIVGEFGCYAVSGRKSKKYAYQPNSRVIYTIDRKEGEYGFRFYYENEEDKPRVSYLIYHYDSFIINIDGVTIADIQFYINSRTNRQHYLDMIPLLKAALAIKEKEVQEEAPFRQLLIGEIAKKYDVSIARAEKNIDILIKWWKFKTREHRALTSDDAKALRMIVSEFGRRRSLNDDALMEAHEQAIEKLRDEKTLAIFYKPDRSYTVLRWKNTENIYVCEEVWKLCADTTFGSVRATIGIENIIFFDCGVFVRRTSLKEWSVVDKRHESWQLVWSHSRWNEWMTGARPQEYLTDIERRQGAQFALGAIAEERKTRNDENSKFLGWNREKGLRPWLQPLIVAVEKERLYLYFLQYHAAFTKYLLTKDVNSPQYGRVEIRWEKKAGSLYFSLGQLNTISLNLDNPLWNKQHIITTYNDNVILARTEEEKVARIVKKQKRLSRPIHAIEQKVAKAMNIVWFEEQHAKFIEEYTDDDGILWEDYKEGLKEPRLWPDWIDRPCSILIERGIDINGWTLEKLITEARQYDHNKPLDEDIIYYAQIKGMLIEYKPIIDDEDEDEED